MAVGLTFPCRTATVLPPTLGLAADMEAALEAGLTTMQVMEGITAAMTTEAAATADTMSEGVIIETLVQT